MIYYEGDRMEKRNEKKRIVLRLVGKGRKGKQQGKWKGKKRKV
jgi:hypothetical protein